MGHGHKIFRMRTIKKPYSFFLFLFLALWLNLLLNGCRNDIVFSRMEAVPVNQWYSHQTTDLAFTPDDTLSLYSMELLLRHTVDYAYSNFFLFLEIEFPDQTLLRDTLECILAERDGRWTGRGSGAFRSHAFLFRDSIVFPQSGTYLFWLQHGMRDEPLSGIGNIGLQFRKK